MIIKKIKEIEEKAESILKEALIYEKTKKEEIEKYKSKLKGELKQKEKEIEKFYEEKLKKEEGKLKKEYHLKKKKIDDYLERLDVCKVIKEKFINLLKNED